VARASWAILVSLADLEQVLIDLPGTGRYAESSVVFISVCAPDDRHMSALFTVVNLLLSVFECGSHSRAFEFGLQSSVQG
jgi:hypothetical protein